MVMRLRNVILLLNVLPRMGMSCVNVMQDISAMKISVRVSKYQIIGGKSMGRLQVRS